MPIYEVCFKYGGKIHSCQIERKPLTSEDIRGGKDLARIAVDTVINRLPLAQRVHHPNDFYVYEIINATDSHERCETMHFKSID